MQIDTIARLILLVPSFILQLFGTLKLAFADLYIQGLWILLILAYAAGIRNIFVENKNVLSGQIYKDTKERNLEEYYFKAKLKDLN